MVTSMSKGERLGMFIYYNNKTMTSTHKYAHTESVKYAEEWPTSFIVI